MSTRNILMAAATQTSGIYVTYNLNTTLGAGTSYPTSIAAGVDRFVIGWTQAWICTSFDGLSWTLNTNLRNSGWGSSVGVKYIKWSGSYFIAIGMDGSIAISPDGVSWTYSNSLKNTSWGSSTPTGLFYGNGYFVASSAGFLATSTNGTVWTVVPNIAASGKVIGFVNDVFILAGSGSVVYSSIDGSAWTSNGNFTNVTNTSSAGAVVYEAGQYIFYTNPAKNTMKVVISGDLVTYSDGGSRTIYAPAAVPMSISKSPSYYYLRAGTFMRSTNGITWEDVPSTALVHTVGIYDSSTLMDTTVLVAASSKTLTVKE